MNPTSNLYHKIYDPDNLRLAYIRAKRGKEHKPGVYRYSKHLNENLLKLRDQLIAGNFEIGNYHFFTIYEPKERLICAAPFPERVLHHAIINICHETFERFQIHHSYATRIGKGQYAALEYAKGNQQKFGWFCKLDVRKYFESIPHDKLIACLKLRFKEPELISLFQIIIASYRASERKGLPIGNLTSQYFANYYLAHADHFLLEKIRVPAYVRYMDDMVLWHNSKEALLEKVKAFVDFISNNLQLTVKQLCLQPVSKGLPFVGYVLFPDRTRLSKQSKQRFQKKWNKYHRHVDSEKWTQEEFAAHINSLIAFTHHANTKSMRTKMIQDMETGHGAPTV